MRALVLTVALTACAAATGPACRGAGRALRVPAAADAPARLWPQGDARPHRQDRRHVCGLRNEGTMIQTTAIRAAAAAVAWRSVAAVGLAVLAFGIGWTVNGWRKDAELAELTAARAQADLSTANMALSDLRAAGQTIRAKADEFRDIQTTMHTELAAIRKDMKNAKPLPADCRPDDQRLRNLTDAVGAAKQAAAAR